MKTCRICGGSFSDTYFQRHSGMKDGRKNECRECCRKNNRRLEIEKGHVPYTDSKCCSWYLGVHIAETILESVFKTAERMPHNNKGFDFICGKGYKVDVKSSCLCSHPETKIKHWVFTVDRNIIADYFAFVAIDNRDSLKLMHLWIVPGDLVNTRKGIVIQNSDKVIQKWKKYEHPIVSIQVVS